jgi:hypothetical protein
MKRKWIRYTIRAIFACVALWILLLAIAFFYIRANKETIVASVRSNIADKISGKIIFDDLTLDLFQNFPGISIDVKNVHVRDSLFDRHKKELINVKHIYMGFGILDVIAGKKNPKYLTLADGIIFFFKDSTGNKNWNILKAQSQSQASKKITLKKFKLKNINTFFEDNGKNKFYNIWIEKMKCGIDDNRNQIKFEFDNKAIIKNASFNTIKGSYLTNKKLVAEWNVTYDRLLKKLSLKNQIVKLDKQSYKLTGDFFLSDDPYFNLNVKTTNLPLKEAASLLPPGASKKINQFQLSKRLQKVEVFLSGPMKYLSFPLANISFSINDASLGVSSTLFEHCSFKAFFNNEIDSLKPRDDQNSFLRFTDVRGEWEKNSFDSKNMIFYNLIDPYLRCDVHTIFSLSQLEKAIASRRLDFNSGAGEATLSYAGPLETKTDTLYDLSGIVSIKNGDITYNPRNLHFRKTNLEMHFQNGDLLVKKMNAQVNDNDIRTIGHVSGFMTFFNTDPSKAVFNWSVYSPYINASQLKSSLRRTVAAKKKNRNSIFERLNDKIDRLFDECNASISLQADKLSYKNFSATKIRGALSLTNDLVRLDNFSLQHAGGSISVSGFSKDNGNTNSLEMQTQMQNVDIKELFNSFNNFGMQSLTSKNISGIFSADMHFTGALDENYNLFRPANKGYVNFSLKNGRLENFKPLMEIDNNFLQKRTLNDVSFAELKDRLDLDGNDIHINRMEIRSTTVNMYVEGIYSFATNTDLSIQIPLKGLKKDQNIIPQNKGVDTKTGMSIFLRAQDDKDGKLKIVYDMFGRFRKKG